MRDAGEAPGTEPACRASPHLIPKPQHPEAFLPARPPDPLTSLPPPHPGAGAGLLCRGLLDLFHLALTLIKKYQASKADVQRPE